MRNPLKLPTTNLKPTLRERFASMKAKAAGLATETSQGRPASPAANPASAPSADAVSAAIDKHTQAYGERLYAEAYRMEDASTRAEQERDAFRALLHTPLATEAERLAYATAVIARASGAYGLECHGSGRAAWMPTAYRNLVLGEYVPEPDMPVPTLTASGPIASDLGGQGVALAHEVIRYFGASPIDPALDGDAALCERAQTLLRATAPAAHPGLSTVEVELIALVTEYEGFARVSDEAVTREDEVGLPLPNDLDNAIDRVRHFTNQGREDIVRHAMALPATTLLGFGLKAQILEHDAAAIWDGGEDDLDHLRCQALLRGLIAAAGLSPISRLEVTSDEIRGWLADPKSAPGGPRMKA